MKSPISNFMCSLFAFIVLCACEVGLAHNEMPQSPEKVLAEADALFVAQITNYKKKEGRCEIEHSFELKVIRSIKGSYSANPPHLFNFTVYLSQLSKWFWQKDCPSVSFYIPPLASDMKVGNEVIVSAKKENREGWMMTGIYDLDWLSKLEKE